LRRAPKKRPPDRPSLRRPPTLKNRHPRAKKKSAKPHRASGTEGPEGRTRKTGGRDETRTPTATGHEDGDEARPDGKPTQTEARPAERTDERTGDDTGAEAGTEPRTGGTEPPEEAGKTGTRRGAADDGAAEAAPAEDKADGERAGAKRAEQHRRHPQREK